MPSGSTRSSHVASVSTRSARPSSGTRGSLAAQSPEVVVAACGELAPHGVDRRRAQAEVLRELLQRVVVVDGRAPQLTSLGRRGQRDVPLERYPRRCASRPLADERDERRIELVEQRRDCGLATAFRLDDGNAVRQERLAVDEPRELGQVRPRRG